jgi:hypothetical protein
MSNERIAMGINLRKNKNATSSAYGKYYPEVDTKKTLSLRGFAQHMADHGSIYTRDVVEGVLLLLFAGGIIAGWRERLLWVALSWFALDMLLHVGLGFGLNEVYIMAAHWLFVIPLTIAYLFTTEHRVLYNGLLGTIAAMTIYLLLYHGYWLHRYLTWPLAQ